MMGRQTGDQSQLFYLFNLEQRIPRGHLLRRINPVVTRLLAGLREKLAPFYSEIGRPSIDPELMIRMLIVGYCYGIRFERRLCEEVELHLAFRGFAGSMSTTAFPITRRSQSIAMAGSGRATSSAMCLRRWFEPAWMQAWSRAKVLPSMPVLWKRTAAAGRACGIRAAALPSPILSTVSTHSGHGCNGADAIVTAL